MKLIADSGSTKTHWVVLNNNEVVLEHHTQGINPYYQNTEAIETLLRAELIPALSPNICSALKQIFYYGAGCSSPSLCTIVENSLRSLIDNADITVNHDLLAAARAGCGNQKGIAIILGTGSNSCLYNGTDIIANQPSLGFMLGDEGSGGYIGKQLLIHYLYRELPTDLAEAFSNTYQLNKENILEHIYQKPMPNRFAASFTPFISKHLAHPYLQQLVSDAFDAFFKHHVSSYNQYQQYPLAAIGSIATVFEKQLRTTAKRYGVNISQIIKEPIQGLIQFHTL
ncbi:MAG: hypothetical protein MUE96_09230 [Bacteroidia bacterium]|jgi:N-acetylglucosamine kinase-like BadF-type ATPase|nr:hypothetical protein [Bacteroidia bacterium]